MILDVGCGNKKYGDVNIDFIKTSQVDVVADIHNLPFRENVFDKVISITVAEHSYNLKNFFIEQYRVLKKDGVVLCITDNASYLNWSFFTTTKHESYFNHHYCIFFPKELKRLMQLANFTNFKFFWIYKKQRKIFYLIKILIRFNIIKKDCLYQRFGFIAQKKVKN